MRSRLTRKALSTCTYLCTNMLFRIMSQGSIFTTNDSIQLTGIGWWVIINVADKSNAPKFYKKKISVSRLQGQSKLLYDTKRYTEFIEGTPLQSAEWQWQWNTRRWRTRNPNRKPSKKTLPEEVQIAILKNNKVTGTYGRAIQIRRWRTDKVCASDTFRIWSDKSMLDDWSLSVLCPIHK